MHTIRTFILRLFIDPDQPEHMRGMIQALPEGEPQSFTNSENLLNELSKLVNPFRQAPDSLSQRPENLPSKKDE